MHPKYADKPRLANSFTEEEVAFLVQLLDTVVRGGDVRVLARAKPLASVYRKSHAMHSKMTEHARQRVLSGKPLAEVKANP